MDKPLHWLTWDELCANPLLQDLPFKIELNRFNQIVMAPANYRHSLYQAKIVKMLDRLLKGGTASPEVAVQTADNVKVPDVVWAPRAFVKRHLQEFALSVAPELCVEILSPANTEEEIEQKRALYFAAGALEVWVCEQDGSMHFYSPAGKLKRSAFCPKFPLRVKL